MHPDIWTAITAAFVILFIRKLWNLQRAFQSISTTPGRQVAWLHPFRVATMITASVFPLKHMIGNYGGKFSVYKTYGSTILASVHFWSSEKYFWVADADAMKAVTGDRAVFQKDVEAYEGLEFFGPNLVGSEGANWKRHRAVAAPAFNEANNMLVWSETLRVVNEWFAHLPTDGSDAEIDVRFTMAQATLLVISSAGFGRSMHWSPVPPATLEIPTPDILPFSDAVMSTAHNLYVKTLAPLFLIKLLERFKNFFLKSYLTSIGEGVPMVEVNYSMYFFKNLRTPLLDRIRATAQGYRDLRTHIVDMVSCMRADLLGNSAQGKPEEKEKLLGAALLRNLVEANFQEGDGRSLTDDELLSNTFLLAGHETSSNTLTFCLPLLAFYPEVQKKMYEEVKQLWPDGTPGSLAGAELPLLKDDFNKMEYTTAFFRETLRMFPSEPRLSKHVHADTSLIGKRFAVDGSTEEFRVPISRGSVVIMDIWAVNMSPLHWGHDVDEFKPERFIDRPEDGYKWPRDAFLSFSAGARGCLGSRFATIESVCILASLVRQYEVLVPAELDKEDIGPEERRKVLLAWTTGITITPTGSKVRLRPRKV